MKRLLNLLFLFFSFATIGRQTDSLRVAELLDAAKKAMNQDAEVGFQYLDTIETFVSKKSHNTYQKADYQKVLGIGYFRRSQYDSSTYHYEQALSLFQRGFYELDLAKISVNLSINYNRLGLFEKTIESATRALQTFEKLADPKGIGISSNIIGQVYFFNEDWAKAKTYFSRYLNNAMSIGDSVEMASGFSNLGSVYTKLKKYDSAILYNKNALFVHQALENLYGIGNAFQNLGTNHLNQDATDSAIYYYKQAIPYYQKTENNSGLAEVSVNLAKSQLISKGYTAAIKNALAGKKLAQQIGEQFLIQDAYKILAESYENQRQFEAALKNYQRYDEISEEIFNEKTRSNIEEINTRYETEKKEQQIAIQRAELVEKEAILAKNKLALITAILGFFALLIIGLLWRNRSQKKQQIALQKQQLKAKESEINATIKSQESERARYARDLHDGFGQMISILNMNLGSLKQDASPDLRQQVFAESEKVIDEMYGELKSICFDLMPQTLIQKGLSAGLEEFAARVNTAGKVFVETSFFGLEERLLELQEISLFRVSQEWINNVIKYSDASKITLQITRDEEEITLLIEDDGMGFEKALLTAGKGNGWKNLNTRTTLILGQLELETVPGRKGNTLIVNAPSQIPTQREEYTKETV